MSVSDTINPQTTVGVLLDRWPELEEVLVAMAPPFARLRNPVLRRTIARVTTLERAAQVGGIPVREMVASLRRAAGLDETASETPLATVGPTGADDRPADWVDASRVRWTVDAEQLLDAGAQPISEVQRRAASLSGDELGLVRSSFRPAPLVELLRAAGYRVAVVRGEVGFATFIAPPAAEQP